MTISLGKEANKIALYFARSFGFLLLEKKVLGYALFFSLTGAMLNIAKGLGAYLQHPNAWAGFSLSKIAAFSSWQNILVSSWDGSFSLGGALSGLVGLSVVNLTSIGILLAALFFSSRLKELFRDNDFAWQIAFYSFGGSIIFLPLYAFFSHFLPIKALVLSLAVAESVSLSIFLVVLLTFFEGAFLMFIKFKATRETFDGDKIFIASSSMFRTLFYFNLAWVLLSPASFSGLFSLPSFLGYLISIVKLHWVSVLILWLQKILTMIFLVSSVVFVFLPLILCFDINLNLRRAAVKSMSLFKIYFAPIFLLLIGGIMLRLIASFFSSIVYNAVLIFEIGQASSFVVGQVFGQALGVLALLIFVVAAIKFLKENHYARLENNEIAFGQVEVPIQLPSQAK